MKLQKDVILKAASQDEQVKQYFPQYYEYYKICWNNQVDVAKDKYDLTQISDNVSMNEENEIAHVFLMLCIYFKYLKSQKNKNEGNLIYGFIDYFDWIWDYYKYEETINRKTNFDVKFQRIIYCKKFKILETEIYEKGDTYLHDVILITEEQQYVVFTEGNMPKENFKW